MSGRSVAISLALLGHSSALLEMLVAATAANQISAQYSTNRSGEPDLFSISRPSSGREYGETSFGQIYLVRLRGQAQDHRQQNKDK
jgi:hypothetical protein